MSQDKPAPKRMARKRKRKNGARDLIEALSDAIPALLRVYREAQPMIAKKIKARKKGKKTEGKNEK